MQCTTKKSPDFSKKIRQFFTNKTIATYLDCQINQVIDKYDENYTFLVSIESKHLLIYFHRNLNTKSDTTDASTSSVGSSIHQQPIYYMIKITKAFPLYGLRLHIIRSTNLQPGLSDCRDLLYQVLGRTWNHQTRLMQIFDRIPYFQQKIAVRNQDYQGMQRTGQFQLGDIYSPIQLKKFPTLQIFEDFSNRAQKILIGTTQTHLIIFKMYQTSKYHTNRQYFLSIACQLQCIFNITRDLQDNQIKITLFKYKKIKNLLQNEKVYIKCLVNQHQKLIRNILKYMTKFHKIQVGLELSSLWKNQQNFQQISNKIKQCSQLEQMMIYAGDEDRNFALKKLSKHYQKLIEYFSARANCYYLIYVNKLNNLFSQNKQLSK